MFTDEYAWTWKGKGKGKGLSMGLASLSKGKGKGVSIPPWRREQQSVMENAQFWLCSQCDVWHPFFHKWCICDNKAVYDKKAAAAAAKKKNRWNRGKTPDSWPTDHDANLWYDYEHDDGDRMGARAGKSPVLSEHEFTHVTKWLKHKGMSADLIAEIEQKHNEDTTPEPPADPWTALQSTRDKLKNINIQYEAANTKWENAKKVADAAEELCTSLDEKRIKLEEQLDQFKKVVADDSVKSKVESFESLISQIQERIHSGIPNEGTDERKQLYNLIFGRNTAETVSEDDKMEDLHFGVDLNKPPGETRPASRETCTGFGPSSKGSGAGSSAPYAKAPQADVVAGEASGDSKR